MTKTDKFGKYTREELIAEVARREIEELDEYDIVEQVKDDYIIPSETLMDKFRAVLHTEAIERLGEYADAELLETAFHEYGLDVPNPDGEDED